jgi:hypothetical protein
MFYINRYMPPFTMASLAFGKRIQRQPYEMLTEETGRYAVLNFMPYEASSVRILGQYFDWYSIPVLFLVVVQSWIPDILVYVRPRQSFVPGSLKHYQPLSLQLL